MHTLRTETRPMVRHAPRPAPLSHYFARLALASGVGYLAAAYMVSRWLTRPTRRAMQESPADWGLPYETVRCRAADGIRLSGWVVEPPGACGTVLLFHGIRRNRESVLDRIHMLAAEGYRCVAFDHRAHGESRGRKTSFGYHESLDVRAVYEWARRRWPRQAIAGLGLSMGAAALAYTARWQLSWSALVLESCYPDIGSAFTSRLHYGYPPWYRNLSAGVIWVSEKRLGVRLKQLAPVEQVGRFAPVPVLVVTGTEDAHATPRQAERLFDRCGEPRELFVVPGAGHKDIFEIGGRVYQERVLGFLERHLSSRPLISACTERRSA